MNERIHIENAKVLMKGQFATGNNNNGPWASINLKVEWNYDYVDSDNQPHNGKMNAVVKLSGDNAVWARDNVTAGNCYAGIPDTFLDLWIRTFGDMEIKPRKDGQGTWEDCSNTLVVDYVQVRQQPQQNLVQQ